ncbi:MAG: peptidoglycan editing factor PgeF [Desulfosoma sp.]
MEPFVWPELNALPGIAHAVFTRHGGVSRPPYATLNTALSNGDDPKAVAENLRRIASWIGVPVLVAAPQVHGTHVAVVDEDLLSGASRPLDNGCPLVLAPQADALVTACRGVGLMIKIADCQAVFLVDPVRGVVANVHCGWRGSVQNILAATVQVMQTRFGTNPADLIAAVSPSLGPCCAEFRHYETEIPQSLWSFQVRPTYFDFWAISRYQLTACGVRSENILTAGECTVCRSDKYFSYRGEKTTGRMAAIVALT